MSDRPYILITNDDGVYAPGIKYLWKFLSKIAEVVVVAPSSEQSAVGLSITVREPLRIEKIVWSTDPEAQVWSISGTPADSVKLALSVILPKPPQLIVSGINRGNNAGRNVLYSGTAAAVVEGTIRNIPGVAFSMWESIQPDYEKTSSHIPTIIRYLFEHPLPFGTFLNVNFPKDLKQGIKGIRFTRQGMEYWTENPEQRAHPVEGSLYYWLGAKLAQFEENPDSDVTLLKEGYATAVPIRISDLTDHSLVEKQREKFEFLVNR